MTSADLQSAESESGAGVLQGEAEPAAEAPSPTDVTPPAMSVNDSATLSAHGLYPGELDVPDGLLPAAGGH